MRTVPATTTTATPAITRTRFFLISSPESRPTPGTSAGRRAAPYSTSPRWIQFPPGGLPRGRRASGRIHAGMSLSALAVAGWLGAEGAHVSASGPWNPAWAGLAAAGGLGDHAVEERGQQVRIEVLPRV